MRLDTRQRTLLCAGLILGAVALWLALRAVDFARLGQALARAHLALALPVIAGMALFYWLKALRWSLLLRPVRRLHTNALLSSMLAGFAANNLLPARMGELLRVVLLCRQTGLGRGAVLATLVLERVLDLLAVAGIVGVALLYDPSGGGALRVPGAVMAAVGLLLLVVLVALALRPAAGIALLGALARPLPGRAASWLLRRIEAALDGFSALRRPDLVLGLAVTSLAQWLVLAGCVHVALRATHVEAGASAAFFVLGLTVAGITLPSAPGFLGTIELCFVLGLKPWGVPPESAFAAAVFYHVLTFATTTGGGLVGLRWAGARYDELRREM